MRIIHGIYSYNKQTACTRRSYYDTKFYEKNPQGWKIRADKRFARYQQNGGTGEPFTGPILSPIDIEKWKPAFQKAYEELGTDLFQYITLSGKVKNLYDNVIVNRGDVDFHFTIVTMDDGKEILSIASPIDQFNKKYGVKRCLIRYGLLQKALSNPYIQ